MAPYILASENVDLLVVHLFVDNITIFYAMFYCIEKNNYIKNFSFEQISRMKLIWYSQFFKDKSPHIRAFFRDLNFSGDHNISQKRRKVIKTALKLLLTLEKCHSITYLIVPSQMHPKYIKLKRVGGEDAYRQIIISYTISFSRNDSKEMQLKHSSTGKLMRAVSFFYPFLLDLIVSNISPSNWKNRNNGPSEWQNRRIQKEKKISRIVFNREGKTSASKRNPIESFVVFGVVVIVVADWKQLIFKWNDRLENSRSFYVIININWSWNSNFL